MPYKMIWSNHILCLSVYKYQFKWSISYLSDDSLLKFKSIKTCSTPWWRREHSQSEQSLQTCKLFEEKTQYHKTSFHAQNL